MTAALLPPDVEKRSSARPAAAMAAFLVFAVVLPLLLRGASAVYYTDTDFLIRYAVVLYAAAKLALVLSQRDIRPVSGVFWIFVYTCMGVAPLAQLTTGRSTALAIQIDDQMLTSASLLTLLGCVCFDVAYHSRLRRPAANAPRQRVLKLRSLKVLRMFSLAALAAGILYIVQMGGLTVFFLSRQEAGEALDAINPDSGDALRAIISGAGSVASLCALIFYIHVVRTREYTVLIPDIFLIAALVVMNVVVNNPVSNSRYWTLAVLFGLVLPLIRGRRALFNVAILGGTLASIFVFPLSDITRRAAGTQTALQVDSVWTMIATKDYDQFTMLANTLGYTVDHGLSWGVQALGPLLFWVPRVVWPDKPYDTGVEVGIWMNNSNLNLSAPLWAEAWINFGLAGVVLAFVGLGVLAHRMDTGFRAGTLGLGSVGYLGISIFAGYLFILLRGSLLQCMGRLMILMVSIFVLTTVAKRREGSTA